MAIKTLVSQTLLRPARTPPSRVRQKLLALRQLLESAMKEDAVFSLQGGQKVNKKRALSEIDGALAEYDKLDALLVEADIQRDKIAKELPSWLEFAAVVNLLMRGALGKKRRPLSSAQQVVANAKRALTRKKRRTMGKRQREKL